MERVADSEMKVQESALIAYSNLVEIAPERCLPLVIGLFQVLNNVIDSY